MKAQFEQSQKTFLFKLRQKQLESKWHKHQYKWWWCYSTPFAGWGNVKLYRDSKIRSNPDVWIAGQK